MMTVITEATHNTKETSKSVLNIVTDDDDDDDDQLFDENDKPLIGDISYNTSHSTLSIGKIKILKPNRRKRRKCNFARCILLMIIFIGIFLTGFYCRNFLGRFITRIINGKNLLTYQPCNQLHIEPVWNMTFPMLTIESAIRSNDVNNDSVPDVLVAFGTGADAAYYPSVVCQVYFNRSDEESQEGCGGGMMALDGITGKLLWHRYTAHELFGVNCEVDITLDGIKDCVAGGRMASMYAIDGSNGRIIWSYALYDGEPISPTSNFYTPLYIAQDLDKDRVPDLILMHGGDPLRTAAQSARLVARLMIVSAATGKILSWSLVPDGAESYYSPQRLIRSDGTLMILFGTGGETHPGGLYVVSFDDLYHQRMSRAKKIYSDCCKGVMAPAVLADINGDSISDIIIALFNSTVIAFDGTNYGEIWRRSFPGSETYSTPAVGYYNDDDVPDFFVMYQTGPGFPIYFYSQANILDGKTGEPLLNQPIKMLIGTQSSPLSISLYGQRDLFLFWYSSCTNITINSSDIKPFQILPGTSVHQSSRADFCSIRFNTSLFTQLVAMNKNLRKIVYDSRAAHSFENRIKIDYEKIGQKWLQQHSPIENRDYDVTVTQTSEINSRGFDVDYDKRLDDLSSDSARYISPIERRYRRHVGMHDADGVQRIISTGTLTQSMKPDSIDLVYTTYWFPAAKNVRLISPEMRKCLDEYLSPKLENKLRLDERSRFKGQDHDQYVDSVRTGCSQAYGNGGKSITGDEYNPYNREMGAMTVYRVTISCVNSTAIKPFNEQMWPSYLGRWSDGLVNIVNF